MQTPIDKLGYAISDFVEVHNLEWSFDLRSTWEDAQREEKKQMEREHKRSKNINLYYYAFVLSVLVSISIGFSLASIWTQHEIGSFNATTVRGEVYSCQKK